MKFFRYYLNIAVILCVLALLASCSSPLQKADKLAMSDPEAAIAAYKQIKAANPGSEEARQAHLKIAETYYKRMSNEGEGLKIYKEVAEAYPKTEVSGEANWAIGMHYFQAKDYEEARKSFAKVTEEIPGTQKADDASLAIAKCYEELKKFEDAAKMYTDFSKTHPQHRRAAQAGLDAARIYDRELGETDKAVEAYKDVAKDYSLSSSGREAKEALTGMGVDVSNLTELPAGEETPETPEVEATTDTSGRTTRRRATNVPRSQFGTKPEEEKRRTVSADFGVDPMDIMPNISADSQGTMYDAMYMFANFSLQSGQYKDAGALYEKAIELSGSKPWDNAAKAYFGLAKSYRGIGMEDKAKEMFKEAIKHDRKIIDAMIISGETHYGEEEYKEALEAYQTALGLVPSKDSEIYYKMGLVYQKLGDADKELESFERSVALKPNFTDAIQHLAEVLYYRKKDSTRANLYDTEARGKGNTDYKVQMELGDVCYKYDSYSWSKIKYNNAARMLRTKIEKELEDIIAAGDAAQAKLIIGDAPKLTLKLLYDASASGNELASNALRRIDTLLVDYRIALSRMATSSVRMNKPEQAQESIDELKEFDSNAGASAEFHFAMGELALLQGDKVTGQAEIKKALEIDPEHKEAASKLKELESPAAPPSSETSG